MIVSAKPPQLGLLLLRQLLAGVDDHRDLRQPRVLLHLLEQVEAAHVGEPEIEDQAVEVLRVERRERFRAGRDRRALHVPVADQLDDALALDVVVLDDQQVADLAVDEAGNRGEGLLERFAFDRLGQVRHRPEPHAAVRLFEQRDDVHRDVPRRRVVLEPIEHRPAVHDRQVDVEGDRVRLVVPRHRQADVAARRRQALESFLVRHVLQDVHERQVVLDDQHDAIAVADRVAIVLDVALGDQRLVDPVHGALGGDPGGHFAALIHRPGRIELGRRVDARQVEREAAARADLAGQPDLAAQQPRDFPADRQPEAGAAVLPAGGAVGLLERLEDDAVLLGRNADAGVGHPEGDHRRGGVQGALVGSPALLRDLDVQRHRARVGELQGVREQVLQHLLQPLRIGLDVSAAAGCRARRRSPGPCWSRLP